MITKKTILAKQKDISKLAKQSGISYLAVFGSVARNESTSNSDVDFMVKFTPSKSRSLGLFELGRIENAFSDLLHHKVDLLTKDGINQLVYPYIKKDLHILYES